jgi:hypothetical protein
MARASHRAHRRDARLDNVHIESRTGLAHCQTRHVPPLRPFSCSAGPENHVLCGAREVAQRRVQRRRLTPGARGTGAGHPPVAIRAKADRISFSGARLPHARLGERGGRNGGRAVLENVPHTLRGCMGTFSRGAPSGSASRRSASQPASRPSRRPKVAATARVRWPTLATAGRRAGAEVRRAPNATARAGGSGQWPLPRGSQAPWGRRGRWAA